MCEGRIVGRPHTCVCHFKECWESIDFKRGGASHGCRVLLRLKKFRTLSLLFFSWNDLRNSIHKTRENTYMACVCICATMTLEIILFVNESSCELISTAYFLTASVPYWKNQLTSESTPVEMRPIQLALIREIFSSFPTYLPAFCTDSCFSECRGFWEWYDPIGTLVKLCSLQSNSMYFWYIWAIQYKLGM